MLTHVKQIIYIGIYLLLVNLQLCVERIWKPYCLIIMRTVKHLIYYNVIANYNYF